MEDTWSSQLRAPLPEIWDRKLLLTVTRQGICKATRTIMAFTASNMGPTREALASIPIRLPT